jgi:predicted Zn-dependent peptidase
MKGSMTPAPRKPPGSRYRVSVLENGVRIASVRMPERQGVSLGFWAGVGGRHERVEQNGMAHFLEHLLFKGTRRRSALELSEEVEGVGGSLDAFTSEDHTCYYAKALSRHLPMLCDVLADMYVCSRLPAEEITREREVIREEIAMYRDQHSQHVEEMLAEALWPRHPLGRPLTGTVESVGRMGRAALKDFLLQHYSARNTIVSAAGDVDHEELVRLLRPSLGRLSEGRKSGFQRVRRVGGGGPRFNVLAEDAEQTQLALGFHAFGRRDPRRHALKLMSVLLGENMSSRLFQRLREQHGLCYSVSSSTLTLAETGAVHISAGLERGKLRKAVAMILGELRRIQDRAPSVAELRKACDYTVGQTVLGLEGTGSQMTWIGESLIGFGRVVDPAETERGVLAVTPAEVQAVARDCLRMERLAVAVIGPGLTDAEVEGWLR